MNIYKHLKLQNMKTIKFKFIIKPAFDGSRVGAMYCFKWCEINMF